MCAFLHQAPLKHGKISNDINHNLVAGYSLESRRKFVEFSLYKVVGKFIEFHLSLVEYTITEQRSLKMELKQLNNERRFNQDCLTREDSYYARSTKNVE